MIRRKQQGGYSLLELVIYLGLFVLLSVVLIQSLVSVMRTYATAQAYRALQQNGEVVMDRITREIRAASTISSATYGTSPGTLSLSGTDSEGNAHTATFNLSGGTVQINDDGSSGVLTTTSVVVTSLLFYATSNTVTDGVKVEITLSTVNGYAASATFYTTVFLRN